MTPSENYSFLVGLVVPRPIALVSTISNTGVANLAPFSFFMIGGANPPSLMVSPVLGRSGDEKDTLKNIRETEEFVVNLVHYEIVGGMNEASAPLPSHESEWERSGFTPVSSEVVRPARVMESLVQFECKLHEVVNHGSGEMAARYIIGEIVRFHIRTDQELKPIARLGGPYYLNLQTLSEFSIERPKR